MSGNVNSLFAVEGLCLKGTMTEVSLMPRNKTRINWGGVDGLFRLQSRRDLGGTHTHKSVMVANMMGILLAKQAASCTFQPRLVSLHFSSHWHEIKAASGGGVKASKQSCLPTRCQTCYCNLIPAVINRHYAEHMKTMERLPATTLHANPELLRWN